MILQETLSRVLDAQQKYFNRATDDVARENLSRVKHVDGFATIITGLRRVGKSTLLKQLGQASGHDANLYVNFEDIYLTGFQIDDFKRLHQEIIQRGATNLYFDEIQLVEGWEMMIHHLLREGFQVNVTGSNASMLSLELGTHLTGRHLSFELLPFSYPEYLQMSAQQPSADTFTQYLITGGLPEYVKTREPLVLRQLLDDVLMRDIAVRQGVKNVDNLRKLAFYLLSNVSRPYSANTLKSVSGIASTSTVIDYISAMRNAYLIDTVEMLADSQKVAARNPKKVYAYDCGMAHALTLSRTPDWGRLLENFVYIHLRRSYSARNIYYFQRLGECDFIVTDQSNTPLMPIQVCHTLNDDNLHRETQGLQEALRTLGLKRGLIVTSNQEAHYTLPEGEIEVVKAWQWAQQPAIYGRGLR